MPVLIANRQKVRRLTLKAVRRTAQAILDALGCPEAELSLVILDDAQIAALNRRYLKRRGPTNVIAFPMQEGPFGNLTPGLLGDVAISVETARSEAKAAGLAIDRRFNELLIHGILHLLGYDHETNEAEAQVMEAKTAELMAMLAQQDQIRNPKHEIRNKFKEPKGKMSKTQGFEV